MKLKAVIVEDEIHARDELEFLLKETGRVEVLEKCTNALEGIRAVNKHRPEVLFLDINLPAIDGFEMLSMIEESLIPHVVFVTAFDEYAIKAFEKNAADYLLKPIEKERLLQALEKVEKLAVNSDKQKLEIPLMRRIPSYGAHKIKLVDIDDIEFVQTDATGVYFVCEEKKYFTDLTLKVIEEKTKLFRCHKQYLINPDKIDEIIFEGNSSAKIKTRGNYYVPVSRHYLKTLKEILSI